MNLNKLGLPSVIIAAALIAYSLLQISAPEVNSQHSVRAPVAVTAAPISVGQSPLKVRSQGTVQPRTETQLLAQVAGEITRVSPALKSGGRFNAGDQLLTIDPSDHQISLQRAQADLRRASAELDLARTELKRIESLYQQDLVSDAQRQQAQRNLDVSAAARSAAQAAIERAQLDLERTVIVAPYTGRVRAANADIGQLVQRGVNLATLYATDRVEVRLPLPDSQLAYLDPSLFRTGVVAPESAPEVTLTAIFAGEPRQWRGKIVRTEGEIDQASRMVHVVAEVENRDDPSALPLPVGLFVAATITGITVDDVAAIPRSAIIAGNQVLVINSDNRLSFRDIDILRLDQDTALVRGGLNEGDLLCLSRLQTPVEGMQVTPVIESQL